MANYENEIFKKEVDWLQTAIAFNAILNYLDDLKNDKIEVHVSEDLEDERAFMRGVQAMGRREVKTVGGGGCPPNKGIDLGGISGSSGYSSGIDILSNSVAKFGTEGGCGCLDKSDNHYHCPSCDKKYSDETNKKAEERTKKCGCGFKFGC
jgi:hypothetical protein